MSNTHGEWLDRIRGRHRKKNRMKDDEIMVMFCNPHDAAEFLDGEDTDVIENCICISPLLPEGEVTLVPKNEFLEWLKGDR